MKINSRLIAISIIFLFGLYFCATYKSSDLLENFQGLGDCPNLLVKKGKDVMVQTAYGDYFAWEEGSRDGVFATENNGREIELSHDDIVQVEIY